MESIEFGSCIIPPMEEGSCASYTVKSDSLVIDNLVYFPAKLIEYNINTNYRKNENISNLIPVELSMNLDEQLDLF